MNAVVPMCSMYNRVALCVQIELPVLMHVRTPGSLLAPTGLLLGFAARPLSAALRSVPWPTAHPPGHQGPWEFCEPDSLPNVMSISHYQGDQGTCIPWVLRCFPCLPCLGQVHQPASLHLGGFPPQLGRGAWSQGVLWGHPKMLTHLILHLKEELFC